MKKILLCAVAPVLLSGCLLVEERSYRDGPPPLTPNGVISMTAEGQSEEFIIGALARRGMDHRLAANELILLKDSGVSNRVMTEMLETPVRVSTPVLEQRSYRWVRYDPFLEDAIHVGTSALAGYLWWKHFFH